MNRDPWKRNMTSESSWPWPCPACASGRLYLEKSSLVLRETSESREYRRSRDEGDHEPDAFTQRFCCLLVCSQAHCKEPVVVCGTTVEEEEMDGEGGTEWKTYLHPVYFNPPLRMISIPAGCPASVRNQLEKAFALYWCDPLSCSNRIRNSVELLLTHLGVPRFRTDAHKQKRRRRWLHERIELFRSRSRQGRELATLMFAVKVIGNEGSHPGALTREDLLDAFELLEHVLSILFAPPEQNRLTAIAKAIHRSNKPRSHKGRRVVRRNVGPAFTPTHPAQ